jgi:hypothetical protein
MAVRLIPSQGQKGQESHNEEARNTHDTSTRVFLAIVVVIDSVAVGAGVAAIIGVKIVGQALIAVPVTSATSAFLRFIAEAGAHHARPAVQTTSTVLTFLAARDFHVARIAGFGGGVVSVSIIASIRIATIGIAFQATSTAGCATTVGIDTEALIAVTAKTSGRAAPARGAVVGTG